MNCYIHNDKEAAGMCVGCGKPICNECMTEVHGKNYCKSCLVELFDSKDRAIEKAESKNSQQPTQVFMNAGGASSSSSASAAAAAGGRGGRIPLRPRNSVGVHIALLLFTAGLGNIIYFIHIYGKQKQWDATYR